MKLKEIDIFNNSAVILERKTPKIIFQWIVILNLFLGLIIILSFFPFSIYKNVVGIVNLKGNDCFVILECDFPIKKTNKILIEDVFYDYKVITINSDNIILQIDLLDNLKIDGNVISVNILKNRTTFFKIIKNKIRKGFGL